ncbi:monocarboxylate transporter 13 [Anguilla rostrata]|nr:monocarboxylate transporter 13 [Anguilla anguilla]XP_035264431.1 monocarboxylate transporter 13 [Anguilla anguilla]XP_035264432.1 monocarboxylate transporter 13 [Anguilla anguilla]XP_035264433.1 monocarboxylate transporter 13 [Anguilla anguilla]
MAKPQPQAGDHLSSPDGGWGWVVVGALFMASALVFGLLRSLGVFFVEFVQYFDKSAQAVSWITSIAVAIQQLMSPVGTALCNAYGARPVVMTGGFLSGLGLVLASQATSLTHLYLTMGLITGSGWALVFAPTVASVLQYFTHRRSLAMALGFTGVGLSSFAFSPLFQLLVKLYAWRGALLILGGLSFNMMVCGALIRPLPAPKALEQIGIDKEKKKASFSSFFKRAFIYLELPLMGERAFLTYALAITLFNCGYFVPYVHLVAHSRHVGFSEYQAAFIISATGVTDLVGRVVSGWVSDLGRLRLLHVLSLWTGLTGLFMVLLPVGSVEGSYAGLLAISLVYGFCSGAMSPLVFSAVPEIVGMQRMLGALGLLQLIESFGGLLGAPLSGWLKDQTGSYMASFLVAGGFIMAGTLVLAALPNFWSCSPPPAPMKQSHSQDKSPECGLQYNAILSPSPSETQHRTGLTPPSQRSLQDLQNCQPDPQLSLLTTPTADDDTDHPKVL